MDLTGKAEMLWNTISEPTEQFFEVLPEQTENFS